MPIVIKIAVNWLHAFNNNCQLPKCVQAEWIHKQTNKHQRDAFQLAVPKQMATWRKRHVWFMHPQSNQTRFWTHTVIYRSASALTFVFQQWICFRRQLEIEMISIKTKQIDTKEKNQHDWLAVDWWWFCASWLKMSWSETMNSNRYFASKWFSWYWLRVCKATLWTIPSSSHIRSILSQLNIYGDRCTINLPTMWIRSIG